ncbi:hypothetical protein [Haloarcula litorea]|uniref:hypothetical protein n=1 Tax=Haloarcula litorea TaxID=3032579 RepID=UPI0023E75814|nr:hypothetical protein [Halomicroarcula sp. GDY20]
MSDVDAADVAPLWLWKGTIVSAALALLAALFAPSGLGGLTLALAATAGVGTVALLYRWGQYRDDEDEDEESRREREMKAEAGGFGGNGGI